MSKIEFEMSEQDLSELLDACKPTPAMFLSGGESMAGTPQENANVAWRRLSDKMHFVWDTVEPGKDQRHFLAEPSP